MFRWIDELNGVSGIDEQAAELKRQIRYLRREPSSVANRRAIRKLYDDLDNLLFKPDYMLLIIDRVSDYQKALKGFKINGIEYSRLVGTAGGIKNSTIVFVSTRLVNELRRRIDNGRDLSKKFVPAKLEAYRALTCSGSTPVSMPNGIAVVDSCITHFKSDVVTLKNSDTGEPEACLEKDYDVELNATDGCGMMLPSLAERWSKELGLDYVMSACNTRQSWEKGCVFTFDFLDFADNVAHSRIIKDAWGNDVDLSNVELILNVDMLKLWDSYPSCDEYLRNCNENHYTFSIPKVAPDELENERQTNYQFIASYRLTDEQIDELIAPTMSKIKDVIGLDWRKTALFLNGIGLTEKNVSKLDDGISKALLVEPDLIHDPFVRKRIFGLIKRRIDDAKIGVLDVHGNYSIASGDLYAMCQNMFGMEVTGLLKAGEIYNQYWLEDGAEKLVCFRAPMSCHESVRIVQPTHSEDARYWFRHIKTCTIFNAFDTSCAAMNGMDFDGDIVMLTDNPVLVHCQRELPAILCAQKKATKIVPTEGDLIQSNINGFGDDIGKITNHVTAMYDTLAQFEPGSKEYEILEYRIRCGQLYQQDAIDKIKGIISKPMPATWYSWHNVKSGEFKDEAERDLYFRILAEKKPYFMRYIYPTLNKDYTTFMKKLSAKCVREFRTTINELLRTPYDDLSPDEQNFVSGYEIGVPVGTHDCVMNRICRKFENEFDGYLLKADKKKFDYNLMKSGQAYTSTAFRAISGVYSAYVAKVTQFMRQAAVTRVSMKDGAVSKATMKEDFVRRCYDVASNEKQLCDIILDVMYRKECTKQLAWDVVSEQIVENLLEKNEGIAHFPTQDENGDIQYGGYRFSIHETQIIDDEQEVTDGYCTE